MKPLVLTLLLAVPAAHAQQMYKCVDPGGKTRYSDKPITDCKNATTVKAPPPPAASGPRKASRSSAKSKLVRGPDDLKGVRTNQASQTSQTKQAKQEKKASPPPEKKSAPSEQDKKYANAQCRELREEEAWLQGPRGAKVENREARLGQVRQNLMGCR